MWWCGVRYDRSRAEARLTYSPNSDSSFRSPLARSIQIAPSSLVHALLQRLAALLQPAIAVSVGRGVFLVVRLARVAEVAVRVQVVVQIAADQLDHDCVIEQPARRSGDVDELKHASALSARCRSSALSCHCGSVDHLQHRVEARVALLDEAGELRAIGGLQHFACAGDDRVGGLAASAQLRLLRDRCEMLEIRVVEIEADSDAHTSTFLNCQGSLRSRSSSNSSPRSVSGVHSL